MEERYVVIVGANAHAQDRSVRVRPRHKLLRSFGVWGLFWVSLRRRISPCLSFYSLELKWHRFHIGEDLIAYLWGRDSPKIGDANPIDFKNIQNSSTAQLFIATPHSDQLSCLFLNGIGGMKEFTRGFAIADSRSLPPFISLSLSHTVGRMKIRFGPIFGPRAMVARWL